MRFTAVVFDLDGTLIDSEPLFVEAARRVLARRGQSLDINFMHQIRGMPGRVVLPMFRDRFTLSEPIEELANEFRADFYAALAGQQIGVMPGARELLGRLRKTTFHRGLATSSQRRYVDQVFAQTGLLEHFHVVLTCDDVEHGKPAPDIYHLAAERFAIRPDDMLVFEDSANGIQAAKSAGATCIAVRSGHAAESDLVLADLIVENLADQRIDECLGLKE